jgi:phosphatidylserine/phosphatidylglycerophosphate/cardiolipin synthase-like enzyme
MLTERATHPQEVASMAAPEIIFLRDTEHGGAPDQPQKVAAKLTAFVAAAHSSVHIAIYDFRLKDGLGDQLIATLKDLAAHGVDVRIAYDHGKPNAPSTVPFGLLGGDPAPKGTHQWLEEQFGTSQVQTRPVRVTRIADAEAQSLVETEPINGTKLMHNKYVIRDVHTDGATVWTGSTNFTNDAWTRQENNVMIVSSPALCEAYETDFQELWTSGDIRSTGVHDDGSVGSGTDQIDYAFAPGEGRRIDADLAGLVSSARRRLKIASMVLTSHTVLGALSDAITQGQVAEFGGVYDKTQMDAIVREWRKNGPNPTADTFEAVARHLAGKASVPFSPESVHDFMHDKVLVADDLVATGSFNFSKSATENSENFLILHSAALADAYSAQIDELVRTYSQA